MSAHYRADATFAPAARRQAVLRRVYLALSLALVAQFLLGMVVNLFVSIPPHHPGARPSNYFAGSARSIGWAIPYGGGWLAVHSALGIVLVLGAAVVAGLAIGWGRRVTVTVGIVGFLAILGAAFNGASFLDYNEDFSSMIMAGLMAVALACYVVGLYHLGAEAEAT